MNRLDVRAGDIGRVVHVTQTDYLTITAVVTGGPRAGQASPKGEPRRVFVKLTRAEARRVARELAHLADDDSRWPGELLG